MIIHDLDLARFLLRADPVEVFATGSSLVDPAIGAAGDVDTAAVTLRFASGTLCQITNSRRASYGYDQRIEVHGATSMLRAENVHEHQIEQADATGFTRAPAKAFSWSAMPPRTKRNSQVSLPRWLTAQRSHQLARMACAPRFSPMPRAGRGAAGSRLRSPASRKTRRAAIAGRPRQKRC